MVFIVALYTPLCRYLESQACIFFNSMLKFQIIRPAPFLQQFCAKPMRIILENLGQWGCCSGKFVACVLFLGPWCVVCVFKIFVGFVQDLGAPPDFDSSSPAPCRSFVSLKAGTLKCAALAVLGPPGLLTTAQELQTCTFEGRGFQSHHQFHKTTSKRKKE